MKLKTLLESRMWADIGTLKDGSKIAVTLTKQNGSWSLPTYKMEASYEAHGSAFRIDRLVASKYIDANHIKLALKKWIELAIEIVDDLDPKDDIEKLMSDVFQAHAILSKWTNEVTGKLDKIRAQRELLDKDLEDYVDL